MIGIYQIGHGPGVTPVGRVELEPGGNTLLMVYANEAVRATLEAALNRPARTFRPVPGGAVLEKPQGRAAAMRARLKAHLGRPYFAADEVPALQGAKSMRFPASMLDDEAVSLQ